MVPFSPTCMSAIPSCSEPPVCPPRPQVDQLAAEVSQLRNANGASVLASEERLRALQGQYEDLLGWVLMQAGRSWPSVQWFTWQTKQAQLG